MLKLLSLDPSDRDHPMAEKGAAALLDLWQERREKHPYMFFMGTDFSKLKAPLVWYDLLHVLDTLSNYPKFRNDTRLMSMAAMLKEKADPNGWYTPESVWTAWKDWEFGQKKAPSSWVTFLALRILERMENEEEE